MLLVSTLRAGDAGRRARHDYARVACHGDRSSRGLGGSTLYVGSTDRIVAIDVVSGVAAGSWDFRPDKFVGALGVSGSTIYAGGPFNMNGGVARDYIAALDAATGAATPWNPSAGAPVRTLARR